MTDTETCLDDQGRKIVRQLYVAVESLGGSPDILSILGSWGDTDALDDADVLDAVLAYNASGENMAVVRDLDGPRPPVLSIIEGDKPDD